MAMVSSMCHRMKDSRGFKAASEALALPMCNSAMSRYLACQHDTDHNICAPHSLSIGLVNVRLIMRSLRCVLIELDRAQRSDFNEVSFGPFVHCTVPASDVLFFKFVNQPPITVPGISTSTLSYAPHWPFPSTYVLLYGHTTGFSALDRILSHFKGYITSFLVKVDVQLERKLW
ncbi:hypothetical protein PILCRDRAFT_496040 [Piloderma croceum F 1598]|uniref:Uncharacterized protein n=1 Tax=Piloderma croceum (strain F 1598) TaxID=765440 RepID=A0A0C3FQT9_PILCF|nr:hypothetical protein PILCRDRAFT_496040 [Piloderma croceum F 1598]